MEISRVTEPARYKTVQLLPNFTMTSCIQRLDLDVVLSLLRACWEGRVWCGNHSGGCNEWRGADSGADSGSSGGTSSANYAPSTTQMSIEIVGRGGEEGIVGGGKEERKRGGGEGEEEGRRGKG